MNLKPKRLTTAQVKEQVWTLADELNYALGASIIQPRQQERAHKNIALTSPEFGTLYIRPTKGGYSVGLSQNSLVARMEPFMAQLTGEAKKRYAHPGIDREPHWDVVNFSQVREAAYFYAKLSPFVIEDNSLEKDLEELNARTDLTSTQRESLVKARLGQGKFRTEMLALWDGACAVTGLTMQPVLIASHAKPWAVSDDQQRTDPNNGLLLIANIDRLFDRHLVSFDPENGAMIFSNKIANADRAILGIPMSLRKLPTAAQADYLRIHRAEFDRLS
jgi:hypothetical protein